MQLNVNDTVEKTFFNLDWKPFSGNWHAKDKHFEQSLNRHTKQVLAPGLQQLEIVDKDLTVILVKSYLKRNGTDFLSHSLEVRHSHDNRSLYKKKQCDTIVEEKGKLESVLPLLQKLSNKADICLSMDRRIFPAVQEVVSRNNVR